MGPNPNGPRSVSCDRAVRYIRYSGLGVRSVGPVGDFLEESLQKYQAYSYLTEI